MARFSYVPEIQFNLEHTLQQLLNRFRSVKHGLPELVKNSKDQYARLEITDRSKRVIVVIANSEHRRLGVLDFAGTSKSDFGRWQVWSDRPPATTTRYSDIEAGNGNGGKGFMCHGAAALSTFESCFQGKRTKMGFNNQDDDNLFRPAYMAEHDGEINDVRVEDTEAMLALALTDLDATIDCLPESARRVFEERNAYSLVLLHEVGDWRRRTRSVIRSMIAQTPVNLAWHPQAALTVESCEIWLVADGVIATDAPVRTSVPEPLPGFEEVVRIPVPDELPDPDSGSTVNTGPGDPSSKFLELRTSAQSLRLEETRPLNVIRVRNGKNVVANWSVADLYSRAESAYIFGRIEIPAFLDRQHRAGADWHSLADTDLVQAVRRWTADRVEELAKRIQQETARDHSDQDKAVANDRLRKLRELMRQFLEDSSRGGGGGVDPPPPVTWGSRVDIVEIERGAASIALARGTTVPVQARAYEMGAGGRRLPVREPALEGHVSPEGVVRLTPEQTIVAEGAGTADLWFGVKGSSVESNRLRVEVVQCTSAAIGNVPERVLLQGESVSLRVTFASGSVPRADLLVEGSVDELNMGRISRHGVLTAGGREGTATVRIRYGPGNADTVSEAFRIGTERVVRTPRGAGEGGRDIPLILLCGMEVPGKEEYPPEDRTIHPSQHEPTIIDFEPTFENVIFINPDSREAIQVREGHGGRRGVTRISTQTFGEFLALKCFEILKRLKVFQEVGNSSLTPLQYREYFARAEQECAPFIQAAFEVARKMAESQELDTP